jgi:hypothetical protein
MSSPTATIHRETMIFMLVDSINIVLHQTLQYIPYEYLLLVPYKPTDFDRATLGGSVVPASR